MLLGASAFAQSDDWERTLTTARLPPGGGTPNAVAPKSRGAMACSQVGALVEQSAKPRDTGVTEQSQHPISRIPTAHWRSYRLGAGCPRTPPGRCALSFIGRSTTSMRL